MKAKQKKQLLWGLIAALLILAAALTYFLSQSSTGTPSAETTVANSERDVLKTPLPNASDDEKRQYSELVDMEARETSQIQIQQCQALPKASKVKINTALLFQNKDATEHTIIFSEKQAYTLPANSEKQLTINFPNGPGIYAFGCDRGPKAAGVLLVSE